MRCGGDQTPTRSMPVCQLRYRRTAIQGAPSGVVLHHTSPLAIRSAPYLNAFHGFQERGKVRSRYEATGNHRSDPILSYLDLPTLRHYVVLGRCSYRDFWAASPHVQCTAQCA